MANLVRRREGGGEVSWDPWRMMRELFRWDPFAEMALPSYGTERPAVAFTPQFDVKETKDAYVFKADLPGIKESDLDISLTGNRLVVGGRRESEEREEGETYFAYERSYGSFQRAFTLPEGTDPEHVAAELKDGVLTLTLPKKPEVQPKRISVKAGGGKEKVKA